MIKFDKIKDSLSRKIRKPHDLKNSATVSTSAQNGSALDNQAAKLIIEQDPRSVWQKIIDIGVGAFGKVYKVKNKSNGVHAAAKIIENCSRSDLEDYILEIRILHECNHKNIIKLYEAYYFNMELWVISMSDLAHE